MNNFKNLNFKSYLDNDYDADRLIIQIESLALLTLQPPIRTSYYSSSKIIHCSKHNDKINNFIFIKLMSSKSNSNLRPLIIARKVLSATFVI